MPGLSVSVLDTVRSLNGDVFGLAVLAIVFFVGALTFVPRPAVCVIGGFVFGFLAVPIALVASTLGAVLAFVIARRLFRSRVTRAVERHAKWRRILEAIDAEGWVLVGLLRLASPLPGSVSNYLLGVTSIGLVPYTVATFAGSAPQILAFVYLGAVGQVALGSQSFSTAQFMLLAAGGLTSALIVWLVARRARASLRLHMAE
jgi:uncharacterized membrane protein YdjX (TVP38/TMEM64 family)